MKRYVILYFIMLISYPFPAVFSQETTKRNPFNFPVLLSGNFGELRANHFHSGIDFKTRGVEGEPVHAVQEGYISRVGVSPWGYGNVLYMDHPDGTTTVYAHLQRFEKTIAAFVKEQQYINENFTVQLYPDSGRFAFKQGDVIAFGGNSGSSAGPHLHFEIRDTKTEEVIDPLIYYKNQTKDTRAPRIQGLRVYPVEGRGVVNGSNRPRTVKLGSLKNSQQMVVSDKIEAWGDIAFGIKAFDAMDQVSNIFGVKEISLMKDSVVLFHCHIDRFSFDETRYINSFTDYAEWRNNNSFYMKSHIEPGNRLRFVDGQNRGVATIDEERTYLFSYLLSDLYGNTTMLAFKVEGKKQAMPETGDEETTYFNWRDENRFGAKGIRLSIPRGNLYSDMNFRYHVKEDSTALAAIHTLHNEPLALHKTAKLSLRLQQDLLDNKQQYGIVRLHKGQSYWIGGVYRNGWIDADIREMAGYTIDADTVPPVITPVDPDTWVQKKRITIRISDRLSGIATFRGEIDGQYALFEFDGKKGLASYSFDAEKLERGTRELTFTVVDACGNTRLYTRQFTW